jgi:hypothetical protein
MKMLFKIYLLSQLLALPFVIGALGNFMGDAHTTATDPGALARSSDSPRLNSQSYSELCDALHGAALNSVQDDIQQLKFITADLYGEWWVEDCFADFQAR